MGVLPQSGAWLFHVKRGFDHFRSILRRESVPADGSITQETVRQCVGRPDPTILEVGCNDGTDTRWLLETFDNPRVFCFEPDPRAVRRFRENIGSRENVQLFELALSDREGEATFYQSGGGKEGPGHMPGEDWDKSGSIHRPTNHLRVHPWVTFERTLMVKTTTLDRWREAHQVGDIDFLWMDVQGAEMDVFRGGAKTLRSTRYIYTEFSDQRLYEDQVDLRQILRYLQDFDVVKRYPGDVLLRNGRNVGGTTRGSR